MSTQSRQIDLEFPGVRLYVLNQSMLEPLWKGAEMPYVGVSHGSDTSCVFNGLFPEGQVSESDQQLSQTMTKAFVRFASSGDPNDPALEPNQHWPEAFQLDVEMTGKATSQHPRIQIIRGPLGTGAVDLERIITPGSLKMDDGTQQVLQGYQMGAMGSAAMHHRSSVLARDKLPERYMFIVSLAEKLGVWIEDNATATIEKQLDWETGECNVGQLFFFLKADQHAEQTKLPLLWDFVVSWSFGFWS
jgi:hypothetical protein